MTWRYPEAMSMPPCSRGRRLRLNFEAALQDSQAASEGPLIRHDLLGADRALRSKSSRAAPPPFERPQWRRVPCTAQQVQNTSKAAPCREAYLGRLLESRDCGDGVTLRLGHPGLDGSSGKLQQADAYIFHGVCVLKRARRNFTSAVICASDIWGPKAGMDRPSAPVGGLMPLRITCTTLSGTGA
jgi:hypothetical protein